MKKWKSLIVLNYFILILIFVKNKQMPVQIMNSQQRKYHPLQKKLNAEEESLSLE